MPDKTPASLTDRIQALETKWSIAIAVAALLGAMSLGLGGALIWVGAKAIAISEKLETVEAALTEKERIALKAIDKKTEEALGQINAQEAAALAAIEANVKQMVPPVAKAEAEGFLNADRAARSKAYDAQAKWLLKIYAAALQHNDISKGANGFFQKELFDNEATSKAELTAAHP